MASGRNRVAAVNAEERFSMQPEVPRSWEKLRGAQLRMFAEELVELYHKEQRLHEEIERQNAELTQTNEQLRHEIAERQKLEETLRARTVELDNFAYSIAHDLRAPLVTLGSFAKQLRMDVESGRMDAAEEDIRMIEKGASRMDALVKTALEYARAGRAIGPGVNTPFKEIAEQALADLAHQILTSCATVSVADTFPTVIVDRLSIGRALTNLVRNCMDHRDENSPLRIEIGHQLFGDDHMFFVRDNGKGMDLAQQKRVFDVFYPEVTRHGGIGLAIVKKIIEAHGGKVWLESEKGRGTTISFTLPGAPTPDHPSDQ